MKKQYDRSNDLETHAYEWIHVTNPTEIFGMHFTTIITNPAYQLDDGGAQASATPIYNLFIEQAKKLNPEYISMIIPSRWYAGGKGLDAFREEMITDTHICELHDFLNANECFGNGVEIKGGVCYYLWDKNYEGPCTIYTHNEGKVIKQPPRYMKEEKSEVFIRHYQGVTIYRKVSSMKEQTIDSLVSSQKPFGLRTFVHGKKDSFPNSVLLFERGGKGYISKSEITKGYDLLDKYKIYISRAYNAGDTYPHQILGKPILGLPNTCCTATYVCIGPFPNVDEALNAMTYIKTKFFRFLVSLIKVSQMAPATVYAFVPMQDFSKTWTDEELYQKYGLSDEEINFIESMIKPMDLEGGDDDTDE